MTTPVPEDVDTESGFRLPLVQREQLDRSGQEVYDVACNPGATLAGLRGPLGIYLYSPPCAKLLSELNAYLRYASGIPPAVREVAILAVAREMDNEFEWAAHENVALASGVPRDLLETIRLRKSPGNADEPYASVITLVREVLTTHKVAPDLFAQVRGHFNDRHVVELALLIGNYASTAILLSVFGMQLPPDTPSPL